MQSNDELCRDAGASDRAQRDAAPHLFSSPRLVTRGETHEYDGTASSEIAFIDWFAFTVNPPKCQGLAWLRESLITVFCVQADHWKSTGRGWNGYKHRIDLGAFGLLAYGGEAQKGTFHIELNAQACKQIQDWNAVRLWGETYSAKITRADLAHDDFLGAQLTIPKSLDWLREGKFCVNGRPPAAHLIDDLGSNKGKTLYVGRRGSGKMLRVYEKGKQLGETASDWVRAEVELHNKGRVVPWDVVMFPGQFLAGAYPALGFLSTNQRRLQTTQRAAQISYATMVKNLRVQGGKSLNVMSQVLDGDASAVLAQLVREGLPKRLAGFTRTELQHTEVLS